jgi:hypothetical protein
MIIERNISNTVPEIIYEEFDGIIKINGRAIDSTITEHFKEFFDYLKDTLSNNLTDIEAHINIEYFNTRASRDLMEFFYILKEYVHDKSKKVIVLWYYEEGDEDILECGEDYEELSKLKFEFIEKPEE